MELGYTSDTLIKALIANSLMSKTGDTIDELGDVLNMGNDLDTSLVTTSLMATFAQDARQYIDRSLNGLYATPIRKVADIELELLDDLGAYTTGEALRLSSEAVVLSPGDAMIITDGTQKEEFEIAAVVHGVGSVTVTPTAAVLGVFAADENTRVVRVDYPAAVKYIATRLAAANIFDKFFTAQADKNESQYGRFFRQMARQQLNDILAGATILHGQLRISNLTTDPTLVKPLFPQMGGRGEPYKLEDPGRGGQ